MTEPYTVEEWRKLGQKGRTSLTSRCQKVRRVVSGSCPRFDLSLSSTIGNIWRDVQAANHLGDLNGRAKEEEIK